MRFSKNRLTSSEFSDLVNACRKNLHKLVNETEEILSNADDSKQSKLQIAAAMYSHSLEEYAHLILLDTIRIQNGVADLTPIEIQYFDHKRKFPLVFNELGPQSKIARKSVFDSNIFDSNIFDATDTEISWDLRLRIFNTEIDATGKPKIIPMISHQDMLKAVSILRSARLYN